MSKTALSFLFFPCALGKKKEKKTHLLLFSRLKWIGFCLINTSTQTPISLHAPNFLSPQTQTPPPPPPPLPLLKNRLHESHLIRCLSFWFVSKQKNTNREEKTQSLLFSLRICGLCGGFSAKSRAIHLGFLPI